MVLILSGFAIWGISHILAAVLSPGERSVLGGLFNLIGFSNQLPFIYSCISFFGVLLLLCKFVLRIRSQQRSKCRIYFDLRSSKGIDFQGYQRSYENINIIAVKVLSFHIAFLHKTRIFV